MPIDLLLVEYTGRLHRNGKAPMRSGLQEVFERLDSSEEFWSARVGKILGSHSLRNSFFGGQHESVQTVAAQRRKCAANLSPQLSG